MDKVKVGIIGCGNISSIYLQNRNLFQILDVVACADIDGDKAVAQANQFSVLRACSVEELLADKDIDLVLNLTVPQAHAEVTLAALEAGKHVYLEKPLAITLEDGKTVVETATRKGLLVGGAPDTFLGGGIQTCRKLIEDGWIGDVVAATGFMMGGGPENWHPNPDFFYDYGGGPLFDMGPYYITAFVNLLGPIASVMGAAQITHEERVIRSEAKYGQRIPVKVPTHVVGTLTFESGRTGTLITTFDVRGSKLPNIEVYGTEGTIHVPDPNTFGGPVYVTRAGTEGWLEVPLTHGFTGNSRGIGLADMAYALRNNRTPRCSVKLTYHVLETMYAILESAETGRRYEMTSHCEQPAALPTGFSRHSLDTFR